ncbi:MAG TPA: plasmid recombination protein [Candidatus Mailhella excrementigallinarum]|nr:plasmid recombination protein [Candidatus Mailhella excrementigallinarum]
MSYLVLHMDKFKRESLRGIQSHNRRERRSRSNPDIRHERSGTNYELHQPEVRDYARAVQARIDSLNPPKTVRKDAVVLCCLIVTSDLPFFARLPPEEQRRFFEESRDFLSRFVGRENVISAMSHRDEKTPHMHFLHVPATPDGRLNANAIYTRESLRRLQSDMPEHLKACGFRIERGVEQMPGAKRIHLNTREFKQEKEERERIAADNVKVLRHALDTLYAANELERAPQRQDQGI